MARSSAAVHRPSWYASRARIRSAVIRRGDRPSGVARPARRAGARPRTPSRGRGRTPRWRRGRCDGGRARRPGRRRRRGEGRGQAPWRRGPGGCPAAAGEALEEAEHRGPQLVATSGRAHVQQEMEGVDDVVVEGAVRGVRDSRASTSTRCDVSMSPSPWSCFAAAAVTHGRRVSAWGSARRASASSRGTARRSPVTSALRCAARARRRPRAGPPEARSVACRRTVRSTAGVGPRPLGKGAPSASPRADEAAVTTSVARPRRRGPSRRPGGRRGT